MERLFFNGYTTSLKRKKHQRKLNRFIRHVNKVIAKDTLWKGRFEIRQKRADFIRYDDRSGAELFVNLIFLDKKTGKAKVFAEEVNRFTSFNGVYLFRIMNEFIVKWVNVWDNENPYLDEIDYRKVKFEDVYKEENLF